MYYDCENSLKQPIPVFVFRLHPKVMVVIITAVKEEVRLSTMRSLQREEVGGRWLGQTRACKVMLGYFNLLTCI